MSRGKSRGLSHKKSSGRARRPSAEPAGDVPYLQRLAAEPFAESHAEQGRSRPISRILFDGGSPKDGRWQTWSDIFYSSNDNHRGSVTGPQSRNGYQRVGCRNLLTSRQQAELECGSKELTVLASCDGLVLMRYEVRGSSWQFHRFSHYQPLICNPLTGSYKKLPVFKPAGTDRDFTGTAECRYELTMLRTGSGQYKVCGIEKSGRERACYILELQIGTKEQPEPQWKELMVPLSDEWFIEAATTKDGKVHWLAIKFPNWLFDNCCTIKVLSLDILKEEFIALDSVNLRLCEPEYQFFPWKGAFYHKVHREDNSCSLCVLEDFDTMTLTDYGNFRRIYYPEERPTVLGDDNKLVLRSHGVIFVFDLISKEFWGLRINTRGGSLGRVSVLHTDSLIGCD